MLAHSLLRCGQGPRGTHLLSVTQLVSGRAGTGPCHKTVQCFPVALCRTSLPPAPAPGPSPCPAAARAPHKQGLGRCSVLAAGAGSLPRHRLGGQALTRGPLASPLVHPREPVLQPDAHSAGLDGVSPGPEAGQPRGGCTAPLPIAHSPSWEPEGGLGCPRGSWFTGWLWIRMAPGGTCLTRNHPAPRELVTAQGHLPEGVCPQGGAAGCEVTAPSCPGLRPAIHRSPRVVRECTDSS